MSMFGKQILLDWQTPEGKRAVRRMVIVVLLIAAALACLFVRGGARPTVIRAQSLPTPTSTPEWPMLGSGERWWEGITRPAEIVATPEPLPGLPGVSLGGMGSVATGKPVPFRVLSCPTAGVKISTIVTGRPGWWNISGTAAIPNMEYWKGELSPDGQGWVLLYRSEQPVQDGLLMEFNTRTVPAGVYQLRVLAVDRTGNYPEPCTVQVQIGG